VQKEKDLERRGYLARVLGWYLLDACCTRKVARAFPSLLQTKKISEVCALVYYYRTHYIEDL